MNVELMLSRALAANDAGLMACHDRSSFHPEEFARGGRARPGTGFCETNPTSDCIFDEPNLRLYFVDRRGETR